MEDGTEKSLSHICNTEAAIEVRRVLDLVGDKWSLLIIALLGAGPRRFTQLKRETGSISHRMLTLTLRQLERDGLVSRTVYPVVPPRVEYALTPLGVTLHEAVQSIVSWTLGHLPEIAAARAEYDARMAENPSPPTPSPTAVGEGPTRDNALSGNLALRQGSALPVRRERGRG